MHDRRARRAATALPCFVAVIASLALLPGACDRGAPPPDPAARPVPVVAVPAETRDVPIFLEGLGTVTAFRTAAVRSQVDGRLVDVSFKEGQVVKRGDLLAQVDPRPFQVQLQQAEGALARDSAILQSSKKNLERFQSLLKDRLVSQQQVDDQAALVGQQEGAVRVDQAQAASARLNLDYARITAPLDGVTGIRQVDTGNLVHPNDPSGIVVITQVDPIAVIFTLSQDDLPRVARAQAELPKDVKDAALPVEAYSREGQELLGTGTLQVIDNQINAATATIRLKAVFPNPKRLLWPNQFIKARLRLTIQRGALVVPLAAIQRGPKGTYVYVVAPDQTAALRPIEIAETTADLALLRSGVRPGESVVSDGQNQLRPGSKVAPKPPGGGNGGPGGNGNGGPGGNGDKPDKPHGAQPAGQPERPAGAPAAERGQPSGPPGAERPAVGQTGGRP